MSAVIPSYESFCLFVQPGDNAAVLKPLEFSRGTFEIYRGFRDDSPSVLLESAKISERMGRYSIFAKDPFLIFESKGRTIRLHSFHASETIQGKDAFEVIQILLRRFAGPAFSGFPPFTGGAIGYFGYEAKNLLEPSLSQQSRDDLGLPDIYLLFFDEGVVIDHLLEKSFVFANIRVGENLRRSYEAVSAKADRLERSLKSALTQKNRLPPFPSLEAGKRGIIETTLSKTAFIENVKKAKRYIEQGQIYQANLSQRFSFDLPGDPLSVYESLREINPSAFFGYLDAGYFQILSGSPERLVCLKDGVLETRPIAGTRSRGKTAVEDARLARELILNEKERAEHIMLVDLERNDAGRVAEYGSVLVDELMVLEDYTHVKHIVSNVRGLLKKGLGAIEVLKAFFPGGTITGAPKVRCMQIIDELEPVARGPYTGSLGYLSFTGNMDFNILIRSLVVSGRKAHLNVGAGVVADSKPEKEYEETLYKAESVLNAVFGERNTDRFFERCGVGARVS